MITPNDTLIEVYENQNESTTLKIEDLHGDFYGWLWLPHCDIDYLIDELQKHKEALNKRNIQTF